MPSHHFISYSRRESEAGAFAAKLCAALSKGDPPFQAWLDVRDLKPGSEWSDCIAEAVKTCDSLLYVMTPDSLDMLSECKQEWTYALKCKKPVIPVTLTRRIDPPFRLHNRQVIDFSGPFDPALERLRAYLAWLDSSEGRLQQLEDHLKDAQRDLRCTADENERARIQDDIAYLEEQISKFRLEIADPAKAVRLTDERIGKDLERERRAREVPPAKAKVPTVNTPPAAAPSHFQDRHVETKLIGAFLRDDALRLMTIVGRGGAGKTVLACRLLKSLEQMRLPEDGGPMSVDGIVYLVCTESPSATVAGIFLDLCKLLPEETRKELDAYWAGAEADIAKKMQTLLGCFSEGRVVLLIDNFERAVDPASGEIKDPDLAKTLETIIDGPQHAVKTILTTRIDPRRLAMIQPGRYRSLLLDQGLESPYAEELLRHMDTDGKVGLKDAPQELLSEARRRTLGLPRALEALYAILAGDRSTSLLEILEDAQRYLPDEVVEKLVGEAFSRLDRVAQEVMQALAIFGRPVPAVAIDCLLRRYHLGVDSEPVLRRLFNMQFVRRESGNYYLHPADQTYALSLIPDDGAEYSRTSLHKLAADYFQQFRKKEKDCLSIADVEPHLNQLDHLIAAGEFDAAEEVVSEIDREHLSLWGYASLVIEKRVKLLGRIRVRWQEARNLGHLGSAYGAVGDVSSAMEYYQRALAIAREIKCRSETRWIGNIGSLWGGLWMKKRCFENALELARGISDRLHEGRWLYNLGTVYEQNQVEKATEYYRQALEIIRETSDYRFERLCLVSLATVLDQQGSTREALHHYRQALRVARLKGDKRGEIWCLAAMADCCGRLGEKSLEIEYYERALEVDRTITIGRGTLDLTGHAWLAIRLAAALVPDGKRLQALAQLEDALASLIDLGAHEDLAAAAIMLGGIAGREGDFSKADANYQRALALTQEQAWRGDEAGLLMSRASLQTRLGEAENAEELLMQAASVAEELRSQPGEGKWPHLVTEVCRRSTTMADQPEAFAEMVSQAGQLAERRFEAGWLRTLACAYAFWGQDVHAVTCLEQAKTIAQENGDFFRAMRSLEALADRYGKLRDRARQADCCEQALAIARQAENRLEEAIMSSKLAGLLLSFGQPREAVEHCERAIEILPQINRCEDELRLRSWLGDLYMELGEAESAISNYERVLQIAQETEKREEECQAFVDIGAAYCYVGDYKKAVGCNLRGLAIAKDLPSADREAILLFNTGDAYHFGNDVDQAIPLYQAALKKNCSWTNHKSAAGLAIAYMQQSNLLEARRYFEQCADFCREVLRYHPGFAVHAGLGFALLGLGETEQALDTYRAALKECYERQQLEGRVSAGSIHYALQDLAFLKRVPQPIPGLDDAIQLLENAHRHWGEFSIAG